MIGLAEMVDSMTAIEKFVFNEEKVHHGPTPGRHQPQLGGAFSAPPGHGAIIVRPIRHRQPHGEGQYHLADGLPAYDLSK